jgi:hypothetical protein
MKTGLFRQVGGRGGGGPGGGGVFHLLPRPAARARKYRRAARPGCNGAQLSPVVRQQKPRDLLEDIGLQENLKTNAPMWSLVLPSIWNSDLALPWRHSIQVRCRECSSTSTSSALGSLMALCLRLC